MNPLTKYSDLIWRLKRSRPNARVQLIRHAPRGFINALVKLSIQSKKTRLPPNLTAKLRGLRRSRSIKGARTLLEQQGGFFPIALAALAPLIAKAAIGIGGSVAGAALGSAVSKAINKKK